MIFISGFLSMCLVSAVGSSKWLRINRERIESSKLNNEIKLLHISDLHSNSLSRMNLDIWKAVNTLKFDCALITGDLIVNNFEELTPHFKALRVLAKRVPVYFVDGNHEKYVIKRISKALSSIGVNVLSNHKSVLKVGASEIDIYGLRDYYWLEKNKFMGVDLLFDELSQSRFSLALSHQPQIIDRIKKYSPDLILCGHTHGGQLRLPFMPTLYAPGQGFFPKYGYGMYSSKNTKMFISKGVGATHFRLRFFNRPEITLITVEPV